MKEVATPTTLTQWLREQYPDSAHKEIKQWLQWGQISVNGVIVTNGGMMLSSGDRVERRPRQQAQLPGQPHNQSQTRSQPKPAGRRATAPALPFPIIFQDQAIVVIDKPPHLLTIATESERHRTAYRMLNEALGEGAGRAVFIVHRLDRETSGLLVFARDEAAKMQLQTQFRERQPVRRYIAVVEGRPPAERGTLTHYLHENDQHQIFVSKRPGEGKLAILHYQVRRTGRHYSELEITLETGRHGQIRAQLTAAGHPIAGDRTARSNPLQRLALHAHLLAFRHPRTDQLQEFHSPIPTAFKKLL